MSTIYGTFYSDTLIGTSEDEYLIGWSGGDTLLGRDGNDRLSGGRGNDRLSGGNGNDRAWGGWGDDTLYGSNGDDWLLGGEGNDTLYGSNGNDTLEGGNGYDRASAGDGNDVVYTGAGADMVYCGNGEDRVSDFYARTIEDTARTFIYGGHGNDFFEFLNPEHDTYAHGGPGNDFALVYPGNDTTFNGSSGYDTIAWDLYFLEDTAILHIFRPTPEDTVDIFLPIDVEAPDVGTTLDADDAGVSQRAGALAWQIMPVVTLVLLTNETALDAGIFHFWEGM